MRRPLVLANWKMNGSLAANRELVSGLLAGWSGVHQAEVALCPPALYLPQLRELLQAGNVGLGAQDVNAAESGAYTGEVSALMLSDLDCSYVIVGHSERRQYHRESNQGVAQKFVAAQKQNVTPVLCVGETLEQRDADQTLVVIGEQLHAVQMLAGAEAFSRAVIAYEPVWAIGTGRTATPEQAQQVHAFIRQQLGEMGSVVRILYGGSVKPNNAKTLFACADIDGALVGGASLVAEDFLTICRAAE